MDRIPSNKYSAVRQHCTTIFKLFLQTTNLGDLWDQHFPLSRNNRQVFYQLSNIAFPFPSQSTSTAFPIPSSTPAFPPPNQSASTFPAPSTYSNPNTFTGGGFPAPTFQPSFPGTASSTAFPQFNQPATQYQPLIPIASSQVQFGPSTGPVTSAFFAPPKTQPGFDPRMAPTAAGNLALLGDDVLKSPMGLKQYTPYQPDYNDPHGVKSFVTSTQESLQLERKILGDTLPAPTPYDNEDILRTNLPSRKQVTQYAVLSSTTGIGYPDYGLYAYKPPAPVQVGSVYTASDKMKKPRDQLKKLNIRPGPSARTLQPPTTAKSKIKELTQTEYKYDENSILLHVNGNIKGQEVSVRVQIHKAYKVKDVKEEALSKLKDIIRPDKAKCARLLKGSCLLKEEDTLDDAKLSDNDRLFLIIDKNSDEVASEPDETADHSLVPTRKTEELADEELIPKLTKAGYRTVPEYKKICRMTERELAKVKDFTVYNDWGKIMFDSETDVAGVDLDAILEINHEEIIVYPNDSSKPPIGQKLNKPATIHLYKCFPRKQDTKSNDKFIRKLKAASEQQDAEFISYDAEVGEWTFKVKHFTKYGLAGAMEEEEESEEEEAKLEEYKEEYRKMSEIVSRSEEEEKGRPVIEPFLETREEEIKKVEEVAPPELPSGMFHIIEEEPSSPEEQILKRRKPELGLQPSEAPIKTFAFEPEPMEPEVVQIEPMLDTKYIRAPVDFSKVSKCEDQIAERTEFKPIRMGQSFRVAWRRDGTFVGVGSVSEKKGTFELSMYRLQVHKSIEGESGEEKTLTDNYLSAAYENMMKLICDSCINKKELLYPVRHSRTSTGDSKNIVTYSLDPHTVPLLWKNFVQVLVDAKGSLEGGMHEVDAKEKLQTEAEIWALINALFGNPTIDLSAYIKNRRFAEYNSRRKDRGLNEIEVNVFRKNLLSSWLQTTSNNEPTDVLNNEEDIIETKLSFAKIADELSKNDVEDAIKLATSGEKMPLFALSSLLSNSTMSGERVKELIRAQLKEWEASNIKDRINPDVLKLYEMLIESKKHNQGYDWRRQLGMYMWYDCPPEKSIREIFATFKAIERERDTEPLVPKCLKEAREEKGLEKVKDMCYSLIGTYASIRQCPLENSLNPKGYTLDHMERRLVWLIYYTLKTLLKSKGTACTVDLLETRTGWKMNKTFEMDITNKTMGEFEGLGFWHWAILVCLMSKDVYSPEVISQKIESIISRNIEDLIKNGDYLNTISSKELLLTETLQIPHSIIKRAKGIYYMTIQDWPKAIKCLEEAQEWSLTHKLFWENVAPCIVSKKGIPATALAVVKTILSTLYVHNKLIPDWPQRGMILQKYLDIISKGKAEGKDTKKQAELMEDIKRLLQIIGDDKRPSKDEAVIGKIVERLKRIAGKIQKSYHEQIKRQEVDEEMKEIVPIPFKGRGAVRGVDRKILEEEITHMIYRASKSRSQIMEQQILPLITI
eukprot:TRINITY_DN64274_c2_g1_i1.p1 TRINITY_DN64274_c2_g1~~TRINITY_DN64274_c2_g1_i1.p1  ORF type:complete len:1466 (+),score=190.33 TRINITY_DN64274_c2_g1_i1:1864-6261(+)